jgi:hypothetical protein
MHQPHFSIPRRAIRVFAWDLADEGLEDVLDRLADCRYDGIHLALAYHGGRFYCPHNPRHAIVHAPDGALYFQPLLSCYEEIVPHAHPQYGSGALVARAIERAHERGFSLTAWIVLFNNMTLSAEYPEHACRNALGDVLEGTLCPARPAVREYAQALIEDLAHRVGVDAIEMEDFAFPSHSAYVGASWRSIEIGPNLGYLMSLCFCDECRRKAEENDIDADGLVLQVERMIRQGLSGDVGDRRLGDEIADPYHLVSRYAKTRFETITSLLDDLSQQIDGAPTALQVVLREDPDAVWRWGLEPHVLRQRGVRATIRADHRFAKVTGAFVARYAEVLQLGDNLAVDVPLACPDGDRSLSPPAIMEACAAAGVDRFVFSSYGLATFDMLDWSWAAGQRR